MFRAIEQWSSGISVLRQQRCRRRSRRRGTSDEQKQCQFHSSSLICISMAHENLRHCLCRPTDQLLWRKLTILSSFQLDFCSRTSTHLSAGRLSRSTFGYSDRFLVDCLSISDRSVAFSGFTLTETHSPSVLPSEATDGLNRRSHSRTVSDTNHCRSTSVVLPRSPVACHSSSMWCLQYLDNQWSGLRTSWPSTCTSIVPGLLAETLRHWTTPKRNAHASSWTSRDDGELGCAEGVGWCLSCGRRTPSDEQGSSAREFSHSDTTGTRCSHLSLACCLNRLRFSDITQWLRWWWWGTALSGW